MTPPVAATSEISSRGEGFTRRRKRCGARSPLRPRSTWDAASAAARRGRATRSRCAPRRPKCVRVPCHVAPRCGCVSRPGQSAPLALARPHNDRLILLLEASVWESIGRAGPAPASVNRRCGVSGLSRKANRNTHWPADWHPGRSAALLTVAERKAPEHVRQSSVPRTSRAERRSVTAEGNRRSIGWPCPVSARAAGRDTFRMTRTAACTHSAVRQLARNGLTAAKNRSGACWWM